MSGTMFQNDDDSDASVRASRRAVASVVVALVAMLMAIAAFGWSHYRGSLASDPQVELRAPVPANASK